MPFANNNGVRIYYEVEGEGPTLVLAHGISDDVNSWRRRGYAGALKDDFKLVMFDARGHGQSDKPHDPAAYATAMVDDVVAVLDDIGMSDAHYFGYSMGAGIGFRLAARYPERFRSFVFGGASPYRNQARYEAHSAMLAVLKTALDDPEAFSPGQKQTLERIQASEFRSQLLAMEPRALVAILSSIHDFFELTNDDVSRISVPCLVFCGELDWNHAGAEESAMHMPQATFVSLAGLDHGMAIDRSDLVLPRIKKFLAEVAKP
jgi:pimeloyl-ACP methyl ester carboxylesterase